MPRSFLPLLALVVGQLAACAQPLPVPPRPPAPVPPASLPDDGRQGGFGGGRPTRPAETPAAAPAPAPVPAPAAR